MTKNTASVQSHFSNQWDKWSITLSVEDNRVHLALYDLSPVSYEENPDGWQEAEDQDWPVELLVSVL